MTKPSAALESLTVELTRRAETDEPPPPCAGDPRFTSELPDERREVVALCQRCPAIDPCRAASRRMTWGVWAGIDKSSPSVTKGMTTRRTRDGA